MADSPQTLISWNFENWLTIVLMAVLGFMVLGMTGQLLRKVIGGKVNAIKAGSTVDNTNVTPMNPYMTRGG